MSDTQQKFRKGQMVTGTTIIYGEQKTGRFRGEYITHEGRKTALITDEERPGPLWRWCVFMDTLTLAGGA